MYVCTGRKYSPVEEVDSSESTDVGEEWPTFEDEEVARQREFNQVSIDIVRCYSLKILDFVFSVGVVLCKEITLLRWRWLLRSVQYTYR